VGGQTPHLSKMVLQLRFLVAGFLDSGFGFRGSGFGFRILDFGFQVSGFEFRIVGFRVYNFRVYISPVCIFQL